MYVLQPSCTLTEQDIQNLQVLEYPVYRQIMEAPRYAQKTALRGDIGASSMKIRLITSTLIYYQYILKEKGNGLLARIREEMKISGRKWIKETEKYMKK